jgi:FAD synthetase
MFFRQARKEGDYLIAVATPDHIVQHLKGHSPKFNIAERLDRLKEVDEVDEVVIGDKALGTWEIVKKYQPEVIALGYDQGALKLNLETNYDKLGCKPVIKTMQSYEPDQYHSSILNS